MHVVSLTEKVIFRHPHVGTLTRLLHPFLQWASFQGWARDDLSLETEVFRQKASRPFFELRNQDQSAVCRPNARPLRICGGEVAGSTFNLLALVTGRNAGMVEDHLGQWLRLSRLAAITEG
jgi:hypothetical protein